MRLRPRPLLAAALAAASLLIAAPAQAAPAAHHAAASATITLSLATSGTPVAADWITITGTAPSSLKGARLGLGRKEAGKKWGSAGAVKIAKNGTFSIRTRATGVGGYTYRVELPKTKKHAAAKSNTVGVTVYKWYYLADLGSIESDDSVASGGIAMAGQTYFKSIWQTGGNNDTDYADFNASYKCTTLQATTGIGDQTVAGATLHQSLLADGTEIAATDTVVGRTAPMQADITGVFRVRLQSSSTVSGYSSVYAAWGDARMLCNGQP